MPRSLECSRFARRLRTVGSCLALAALTACGGGSGGGSVATTPAAPAVVNGQVFAMAVASDGTTYLGGAFTRVGTATGSGVPVDAATGLPLPSFPKVVGTVVWKALGDGQGGWFICGMFAQVGGLERNGLAHIRPDGTVDPTWDAQIQGQAVLEMKRSGSILYIGGGFTHAGGFTRNGLAALDAATGSLLPWAPLVHKGSDVGTVTAIEVVGTSVHIGGDFTNAGPVLEERNNLAAFDATTAQLLGWDPNANGSIAAMVTFGGNFYVSGAFQTMGGLPRTHLAELDASGAATAWNPSPDNDVTALALRPGNILQPTTLLVGGYFHFFGATARNHIAELFFGGGLTPWNPDADDRVMGLSVQSDAFGTKRIFACGFFQQIGGASRTGVAELSVSSGQAMPWNPDPNTPICYTAAIQDETIYLGGAFTSLGGGRRKNLAAIDGNGNLTSWSPEADDRVMTLALSGDRILLGGQFLNVNQELRSHLAAVDLGGNLLGWDPGADDAVLGLLPEGSKVYASGAFSTIAGKSCVYVAALDRQTGALSPSWHSPITAAANNYVFRLLLNGSTLYAGGEFNAPGHTRLMALDGTTGGAEAWAPQPDGSVTALALSGGVLYAGGYFSKVNNVDRKHLAAIDTGTGALVSSWNPNPDGDVTTLALAGSNLYVGGAFFQIGGATRSALAAVDTTTGLATPWDPTVGGEVYTLGVEGSRLGVGGFLYDLTPGQEQMLGAFTRIPR
jgi:hypothetical protein